MRMEGPDEWFAESNAAFYIKPGPRLLPGNHPLYKTLDDDAHDPDT